MKTEKHSMLRRVAAAVVAAAALLFLWWGWYAPAGTALQLSYTQTGAVIGTWPAGPGDTLSLEIEHSFEHIPWYEYYTVTDENGFNLDAIAVAGYGAGIPAEMDVETSIEDGLVWMRGINSNFDYLHWITSAKYMKTFTLNGEEIFDFRSLPDASRVRADIIVRKGNLNRG